MPLESSTSLQNILLAAIPEAELDAVLGFARPIPLEDKALLQAQDTPIDAVYFPLTGAISILTRTGDGNAVEAAVVGRQGFVGLPAVLGVETCSAEALVQVPGDALKINAAVFREKLRAAPSLNRILLRYSHFFFKEVLVSNGCNRFHTVEQRIARWLLAHRVRTNKNVFPFTHEFLAYLLGAQRSTVTEATGELQRQGLIRYGYGEMSILNEPGLEAVACECFERVGRELDLFIQGIAQLRNSS
jgi:CRP-like cAMP-binding protein